jgi:hypothetical protein
MVAGRYDLKRLLRLILNSHTYQLSCVPRSKDPRADANFARYPLRRLEAEVLIDALCQVTGTGEQYASVIPEPYTFIPEDRRSIALADASITSAFLEKFGRSSRDTGMESDRSNRSTAAQRLHMLNSGQIRRKFEQGTKFQELMRSSKNPREMINRLYLSILSRLPTEEEWKVMGGYARDDSGKQRGEALADIAWALINSPEFCYRH